MVKLNQLLFEFILCFNVILFSQTVSRHSHRAGSPAPLPGTEFCRTVQDREATPSQTDAGFPLEMAHGPEVSAAQENAHLKFLHICYFVFFFFREVLQVMSVAYNSKVLSFPLDHFCHLFYIRDQPALVAMTEMLEMIEKDPPAKTREVIVFNKAKFNQEKRVGETLKN